MARKIIDIGVVGNDGTGDSIRDSFRKVNDNFRELYSSLGLGERLTFRGLSDTPETYEGQENAILTVNNTTDGIAFKQLKAGTGIQLDYTTNENEIGISTLFAEISGDPSPQLGGNLSARGGATQYRILDLGTNSEPITPLYEHEAINKAYADSKISLAGIDAIDPRTGDVNPTFGTMTGPLILSRDPVPADDEVYDGMIAATKRYVDNSAFGSSVNLYVALSGADERPGVSPALQGRALAYAYRTLEAALKRAEELVNESRFDIGPYKKVLTYNSGEYPCTLSSITTAPGSGSGFSGKVYMSVDTIQLASPGVNYRVGDVLSLAGGTGTATTIEVLATAGNPGAIVSFRLISSGVYSVLPGSANIPTVSDSEFGTNAKFTVTYKVNNIEIIDGGADYGLVSVRISPGVGDTTGSGAFGTADVVGGVIASITITDQGSGFTALPSVLVNLPRFKIFTNGLRTDFTGNIAGTDPVSVRTRDVREGLYIRGETTGALAQILAHRGELDGSDEIFDVDIKFGSFEIGETISYGDITKNIQISVLVESGVYEENYPLKIPQNVAIIGDEFRRVIIRPKNGVSSSPWAFGHFRRDTTIDGLTTAANEYGHHYLSDPSQPVYPLINNKGYYRSAAQLLYVNKGFIQNEIIAWINDKVFNNVSPFDGFAYNESLCSRDVGFIVDAMVFDLKYGGYNRTVSAALKYKSNASGLIAITDQLSQTLAAIEYINTLAQDIISNTEITTVYNTTKAQIIDLAYIAEVGSSAVIEDLTGVITDIITNSGSVNYPKDNDQLDVFLCNDANIVRAVTCQGHGGFMMVLDPEGQILAKSPYAQECASFSKSSGRHRFAGGMFVDGFTGNLKFKILSKDSDTFLRVGDLKRMPNLPASFIVDDTVYRINYVRDFVYSPEGSTASLVLDEVTPWPFDVFSYNESACSRDVGLIIDGLGYDMVLGTNFHARKAGLTYRQANAEVVILNQLRLTLAALGYAHDLAFNLLDGNPVAQAVVRSDETALTTIIENGRTFAPALTFTIPTGLDVNLQRAKTLLESNIGFIRDEAIGWINYQITNNIPPYTTGFVYDSNRCARDVEYIVEALIYDLVYGGNSQTRDAGLKYYDGVGDAAILQLAAGQELETSYAVDYVNYLAKQVVQNLAPATTYSSTPRVTGTAAVGVDTVIDELLISISDIINSGVGAAPTLVLPDLSAYSYDTAAKAARTTLQANKVSIQADTVVYVNDNANVYEILMPGNRSMLANDFTQVNDMGYGLLVTNGALLEAVSVFTYYCYISYYALNGGQIRSVSGSSSHGVYALVAEGSDPLEVPTPVNLYYDLAQGADVYFPSPLYANTVGGLFLYVNNFTYLPLNNGEMEVIHSDGAIYRYSINSVDTEDLPAGVAKLNISSTGNATSAGLEEAIPDGTRITIRQNSQVVLTGDVVAVATRPSTALKLNETEAVYRVLQFEEFTDPEGSTACTISVGDPAIITATNHKQVAGYIVTFSSTGTLPSGIVSGSPYYILSEDITENTFKISTSRNGAPIETTSAGTGTISFEAYGLARTTLRENYNYVEVTAWQPNEFSGSTQNVTVTIASPAVFETATAHGLVEGDVLAFTTTGNLPGGISTARNYFVIAAGLTATKFQVSLSPGGPATETTGSQTGTHSVGKVKGRVGDTNFAVVPIGPGDRTRIIGMKVVWVGEEYTITQYDDESVTGEAYARIHLNRGLVNDVLTFDSPPSLKAAVPSRTSGSSGTLTIRIALTRVTGHDLLEIGTGSYADTNYPNEIYGGSVNPLNDANETQERGSGRVFYVTTDQFGNFNVGPYFRVDQGTGRVTFSAAIALSNLDGIGFKRGVPIAEFSTDSSFSDNATDTVPTENATRIYVERRLGVTHTGAEVPPEQRIPSVTGGFMPLTGLLPMSGEMNLGNNKIADIADPTRPQDAVNLRSLRIANLQDFGGTNIKANDLLVFTGVDKETTNAEIIGDIALNIDSTANTLDAQINPGVIVNSDINASAGILQSKLSMVAAGTRAAASGITQADRGLASFDSAFFDATDGWISVKNNSITFTKIEQVNPRSVIGNSTVAPGTASNVTFSTVVDSGGAVKKTQYSGVGYLKRTATGVGAGAADGDYTIVADASTNTVNTLVRRDSNGDFAARKLTIEDLSLQSSTDVASTLILTRTSSATGGSTRIYGFSGNGGVLIGNGSTTGDNITTYANDRHDFRTQNRSNLAPVVCSTVYATALSTGDPVTGGDSTAGTITGQWILASAPGGSTKGNSRLQATYAADLAEFYEGDKDYDTGTVLVFGGDKEVTTTNIYADTRVAGVVSDNAAYSMYGACPGFKNQIALQGRVPCKVVGKIKKGDILVTSKIPGVAMAATGEVKAGTSVGKALQEYNSDHIGTIEVAVGRT